MKSIWASGFDDTWDCNAVYVSYVLGYAVEKYLTLTLGKVAFKPENSFFFLK
jgi:hypothetical protein